MATGRPKLGDVQLKDSFAYYQNWIAPRGQRSETLRRTLQYFSTPVRD